MKVVGLNAFRHLWALLPLRLHPLKAIKELVCHLMATYIPILMSLLDQIQVPNFCFVKI